MSGRPTDDEIRAMLEARSGALPAGADREVLGAARAQIAGSGTADPEGVRFGLRPVATVRRPSRAPWGIAAAAVAAVVAVAVLGTRPAVDRPTASQAPGTAPAIVAASPSSTTILAPGPAAQLMGELAAGRLDGKTLVIPGRVGLAVGRCRAECTFVKIDGLPELWIDKGDRTTSETRAAIDALVGIPVTVLRVENGAAELLGWLAAGADSPIAASALALARIPLPKDGLVAVQGWLHPAEGILTGIANWDPANREGHDISVSLDEPVASTVGTAVRHGTYLLRDMAPAGRSAARPSWHVVGTLDEATTVRVDQPRTDLAGPTIPAADLLAAIGDGSLDGQVFAVDGELQTVIWDCPLDARPCLRFFVDGLPGIAVTWDGALLGSTGEPGGRTSVLEGRLLVTPRRGPLQPGVGYLELLGVLHGDLGRPVAGGDLAGTSPAPRDPLQLEAVDGWLVNPGARYCALAAPGEPPCGGPALLTGSQPGPNGDLAPNATSIPVAIHKGAPGIGPATVTAGPFLVREAPGCPAGARCAAPLKGVQPRWQVVARYDPGEVRVVTFP